MRNYKRLQNGSDIRGIALIGVPNEAVNFTDLESYHLAISFSKWLSARLDKPLDQLTISVGSDSRLSGDTIKKGIFNGVTHVGAKAVNCGLTSTPSMYMSTLFPEIKADGAIMITASHLPYNRNGMKFFTNEGGLSKKDISTLVNHVDESISYSPKDINVTFYDLIDRYSKYIVKKIRSEVSATNYDTPLQGSKIIVDAGNGAGGFFAEKVLKALGADTTGSQFLDPDGTFPNHIPNPEDEDAITSVIKATLANHADLGIIFDTDVDRAAVIDSQGKAINRNNLIGLMSAIVLEKDPKSTIVTDSVTSTGLTSFIESLGGIHHRFKRGYKNVIDESIRLNNDNIHSGLAMETSGHGAFKENYFLDDGAYIVTKILIKFAELKKEGKEVSSLIDTLEEPLDEYSIRVKINLDDFADYGKKVLSDFELAAHNDSRFTIVTPNYEGVRVNYDINGLKGWILVRMSLHDPVIPINIESNSTDGCKEAIQYLLDFLNQYSDLIIP